MGRDEAITAIESALAPSLEWRIGKDHIALENEVTRPRVIREQWVYVLPVTGLFSSALYRSRSGWFETGS